MLIDKISGLLPDGSDGSRRGEPLALCLLASCALWLIWPVLVEGRSLYFRDMQLFFVPMKQFLVHWLSQGVIPFWSPAMLSGSPFFADMQTSILYPPTVLLLLAEGMHGLGLLILFHLLLAAFSAFYYGRFLGLSVAAAYLLALLFSAGGLMVSSFNMINLMQALAWLPLGLLCFERDAQAPTVGRFALSAVVLALQIYAGAPEVTLMLGLLVLVRLWIFDWRCYGRRLVRIGFVGGVAMLLAAPQLLPTYELFDLSVRTEGLGAEEIASYSLRWEGLAGLAVSPAFNTAGWDIFGLFPDGHVPLFLSLYLGVISLLLALVALLRCGRSALTWLMLASIGVFLATAGSSPLALGLFQWVGVFRYPEKYTVLFSFALMVLAALGLDALRQRWIQKPWMPGLLMSICVLVTLDLVTTSDPVTLLGSPDYYRLDQLAETRLMERLGPGRVYSRSYIQPGVTGVAELYDGYRRQLSPYIGTLGGVQYITGTAGLELKSQRLVAQLVQDLPPSPALAQRLAFLGVRYVVSADPAFANSRGWRQVARPRSRVLWDLGPARPWAYFPTVVIPESQWSFYRAVNDPEVASGLVALTTVEAERKGLQGRVLSQQRTDPNHMSFQVEVPDRALLVVSESFYPGWGLKVDGASATIERVNQLYMGVWLEPGFHRLEFEFVPQGLYLGALLALMTLLILAIAVWRSLSRQGKPPVAPGVATRVG